jgi:Flp pilus assembly protein TadD
MTFLKTAVCVALLSAAASLAVAEPSAYYAPISPEVRNARAITPKITPVFDVAKVYRRGVDAFQAGDYEGARKAMVRVLKVAPDDANSRYVLGMTHYAQGDYQTAVKELRKSVKINDGNADAHAKLALSYLQTGDAAPAAKVRQRLDVLKAACRATCENASAIDAALIEIDAAR